MAKKKRNTSHERYLEGVAREAYLLACDGIKRMAEVSWRLDALTTIAATNTDRLALYGKTALTTLGPQTPVYLERVLDRLWRIAERTMLSRYILEDPKLDAMELNRRREAWAKERAHA